MNVQQPSLWSDLAWFLQQPGGWVLAVLGVAAVLGLALMVVNAVLNILEERRAARRDAWQHTRRTCHNTIATCPCEVCACAIEDPLERRRLELFGRLGDLTGARLHAPRKGV